MRPVGAIRREIQGSGVEITVLMPGVVATELAAGTSSGMAKLLTLHQIADTIEGLIRRPRPELFIPALGGYVTTFLAVLPARVREFVHRRLVPDQAAVTDRNARDTYEKKMLGS